MTYPMKSLADVFRSIENAALIGSWRNCVTVERDTIFGVEITITAPTLNDALAGRDRFINDNLTGYYPRPASEPVQDAEGKWVVRGWRASNCD